MLNKDLDLSEFYQDKQKEVKDWIDDFYEQYVSERNFAEAEALYEFRLYNPKSIGVRVCQSN